MDTSAQLSTLHTKTPLPGVTGGPRLGFLGVGWIGKNRMEAIAHSQFAQVVAIADPSADNLRNAESVAPQAQQCQTLEELLELDLDGVVIATPSALHAEQCIAAFEKGVAVFCQKPLGRNTEETRRVVTAARQHNRLLGVDLSYRFTCFRKIYDLIRSGAIGEVYAVELVFHNAYGPDKPWFYNPQLAGGGCLIDLGIHLVDMALWALDYPAVATVSSKLYAQGRPLIDTYKFVEDYATALIEVTGSPVAPSASIQLTCSWNLPAGKDAEIQANFYGTKGGVAFRNINGSFYEFSSLRFNRTSTELLFCGADDWGGRAAVDWTKKLAISPVYDAESEHLVKVAEVLDRIYHRQ